MDEATTQAIWKQLETTLLCGSCKAVRFLIWDAQETQRLNGRDPPAHAQRSTLGDAWYVAHCDYFRRPIAYPDILKRCGAFQRKAE